MSENVGAVSFGFDLDSSSLESQITSAGEKGGGILSGILSKATSGALGSAASKGLSASFKTLKGDSASLTDQIGNQKRAVQELQSAMEKSVSETGADSRETSELREKVEAAQSSLEKMSRSLKETNSETEKSPGKFSSFANSASGAGEKSSFLSGMLGKVKNAALGMGATIGGGAGLFALAQSAVDTGNAAYELSEKLHISSAEATQFSKMLKISDTDAQPFISTMMRLDKSVETAGKKGNATTSALKEFGISLTDAHGKLLPMNGQLAALAAGYKKAEESGNDEAFTAEILGSRGTALTNIFANYNDVLAETGKAKGIGIDPNQAHRVFLETQSLKLQLSQLGMVLSNAVIPVASSIIPPLMTQFSGLADKIKNHQSQIQSVANTVGNLGKTVLSVVVPPIKSVFGFISSHGQASVTLILGIVGGFMALKTAMMVLNTVSAISNGLAAISAARAALSADKTLMQAAATKTATGAQVGMNAAILASPTTWWILGITAVVTAFALLWQNCAGFRNFWIGLWNGIKGAAQAVGAWFSGPFVNFFKSAGNGIKSFFTGIPGFFSGIWNGVKSGVTMAGNGIKTAATTVWNGIRTAVTAIVRPFVVGILDFWRNMQTGLHNIMSGVKNMLGGAWQIIKNVVMAPVLLLCDLVTGNFGKMGSDLGHIGDNIKNGALQVWNGLQQYFTGILQTIVAIFQTAWEHLTGNISAVWNGIVAITTAVWNGLVGFFSALPGRIGGIMSSIGNWIQGVWNGLVGFISSIPGRFASGLSGIGSAVQGAFSSAINFIKNLPGEALQWGKDIINGIVNGIKSAAGGVGNAVNGVAQNIRSFLHFSEPDIGPLKGFHGWWKDMMQGAGEDITGNSGYVMAALHSVTSQMRMAIQPTLLAPQLATAGSGSLRSTTITNNNTKAPVINVNGPINVQSKGGQNATLQQLQFLASV